ncbi:MAG TPA: response regulator [Thermodesulfobacteriota bacterium]|nr:response regulator [Thermodesulfobacteriota bacterium]
MAVKKANKALRHTPLRGTPEQETSTHASHGYPPLPKEFLKALVADDNAATRILVKDYLELLGFEVVALAANGEAAVELFKEHSPGIVIMDFKMPKMSGIEAAREISKLASVPIILLTGHSSEDVAQEAIEAGVFGYLVKPVTKKQLLPAIRLAIARFEQFRKLREDLSEMSEAIEARKLVERAKGILMKRCNIGEEEAFKLLQSHSQKENKKMRDIALIVIEASKLI